MYNTVTIVPKICQKLHTISTQFQNIAHMSGMYKIMGKTRVISKKL